MYDLRPFVEWIVETFEPAARVDGVAGRYVATIGDAEVGLYGLADMACILHTVGAMPEDESVLTIWRDELAGLQDVETGYILERQPTHCALHNTAFALGAMYYLEQSPKVGLGFAGEYDTPDKLRGFLQSLDWENKVYGGSHAGAGLASAFAMVPETVDSMWFDAYFECLDGLFDSRNGMLGCGKPAGGDTDQIGGTFHYAFLYEHFGRRMSFAEQRIDAIIGLQQKSGIWQEANPWWLTLDAIYLLTRAERQSGYRKEDVVEAVRRAVDSRFQVVMDEAGRREAFCGKMGVHRLTSAISLFAEAQQYLGVDKVVTNQPLRLVLDERPFI